MLPFFHRYDHTNYAGWGLVYLAQMKQLPDEVQAEFDKANWVVKGSLNDLIRSIPFKVRSGSMAGTGKRGGRMDGKMKRKPTQVCRLSNTRKPRKQFGL